MLISLLTDTQIPHTTLPLAACISQTRIPCNADTLPSTDVSVLLNMSEDLPRQCNNTGEPYPLLQPSSTPGDPLRLLVRYTVLPTSVRVNTTQKDTPIRIRDTHSTSPRQMDSTRDTLLECLRLLQCKGRRLTPTTKVHIQQRLTRYQHRSTMTLKPLALHFLDLLSHLNTLQNPSLPRQGPELKWPES